MVGAAAIAALALPLISSPATAAPVPAHAAASLAPSDSVGADLDGRQIAEALLFVSGPSADRVVGLPAFGQAVRHLHEHRTPETDAAVVGVLDGIEARDPALFAGLSREIRSGDPYRVEAALVLLSEAVHHELGGSTSAVPLDLLPPSSAAVVGGVLVAVLGVTAVSVVNAVHAANALWTVNWAFSARDGERAVQAVSQITEAFAA